MADPFDLNRFDEILSAQPQASQNCSDDGYSDPDASWADDPTYGLSDDTEGDEEEAQEDRDETYSTQHKGKERCTSDGRSYIDEDEDEGHSYDDDKDNEGANTTSQKSYRSVNQASSPFVPYGARRFPPTSRRFGDISEEEATGPSAAPSVPGQSHDYVIPGSSILDQDGEEPSIPINPAEFSSVDSKYWQPRNVFKMLWSEPQGNSADPKVTIRRFIIVATDHEGSSICVPILKYDRFACIKPGIHGIIYNHDREPVMVEGEKDLGFPPVRCILNPYGILAKESRVNYSKLTTIGHNVRVQFIGAIPVDEFEIMRHAVEICWQENRQYSKSYIRKPAKVDFHPERSNKTSDQPEKSSESLRSLEHKARVQDNTGIETPPTDEASRPKYTDQVSTLEDLPAKWGVEQQGQHTGNQYRGITRSVQVNEIRYDCEIPQVVEEMRKAPGEEGSSAFDLLANLIVISGSLRGFECTTCRSYLSKRWKGVGLRILEQLSGCIDSLLLGTQEVLERHPPFSISIESGSIRLSPTTGQPGIDSDVVEAFTWLCTAVRRNLNMGDSQSSMNAIYLSLMATNPEETHQSRRAVTHKAISPRELQDSLSDPDSTCWLQMFKTVVISWQPEDDWFNGRIFPGLEIPFAMMVHLASAERYHQVNGGIVLLGFSTALVPMQRHPESNAIQWHFETVETDDLIQPSKLNAIQRDWYKTTDVSELVNSKCFVGWFEQANVMLGTNSLVTANVFTWSHGTRSHHRTAHREGFEGGGQISIGLGPINIQPQVSQAWRFHSNVQRYSAPSQYTQAIRLSARKVATVIDTGSQQAWLIPMLSLVLHLCHRYFLWVQLDGEMVDPIPFAEPSPDGASAAIRALESKGDVTVIGHAGEVDCETLRQLVLRINTNLLDSSATREPPKRNVIYASELMDAVVQPGTGSVLKEIVASEHASSWQDLAGKADVIGVCAGIGEVIQPLQEPGRPIDPTCGCLHLPRSRYLLAAHMQCLETLSLRAGDSIDNLPRGCCMLGENVFWTRQGASLWSSCGALHHQPPWTTLEFVQQISRKEKNAAASGAMPATAVAKTGVVVFGTRAGRRLQKRV